MELKAQTKWGWGVAAYLFLVATGTGAYVVGVLAGFQGGPEWDTLARIGIVLGFPCCAAAGFVKLAQLGNPKAAWRAWMRPNTSWIARGTLLLFAYMLVAFLHLVLWVAPGSTLGIIGGVLAIALMLYSGILLTAARPIALWSTAMLPFLFLISALLAGILAVMVIGVIGGQPFEGRIAILQQEALILLVLKALGVFLYFQSTHRDDVARASVRRILTGQLAPMFWFGVVLGGLVLPVLLGALALGAGSGLLALVGGLGGLGGALLLRFVVLAGGIHAPLRAGSFEVALPIV